MIKVWVINDQQVFESVFSQLRRDFSNIKEETHSLGFRSVVVLLEDKPVFGVILTSSDSQSVFQSIQWVHKNWQTSEFISFNSLACLKTELFSGQDYLLSVPKRCLRSAGIGDLKAGPLLFEEMSFSESVQMSIASDLVGSAHSLIDPQINLFSGLGLEYDFSFEKTITQNLNCVGWDTISGEILQTCRRLAVRAGALMVIAPRHEYRLGALDSFLKSYKFFSSH